MNGLYTTLRDRAIVTGAFFVGAFPAVAQTAATEPTNFTPVIVALVGGVFSVIGVVATAVINARMKDSQDAATMSAVTKNALGAMQQAATAIVPIINPQARIPGLTPQMQVGLQYALDHAGTEFERAGITPAMVADKINAQLGLANIATNQATASSPAASPPPLAAVPNVAVPV